MPILEALASGWTPADRIGRPSVSPSLTDWRSIALGVLAFLAVVGIGFGLIVGSGQKWTAKTSLVLLPGPSINQDNAASYFDTLSSGQLTSTASQILGLDRFKNSAAASLHLSPSQAAATSVTAAVVTGSSIITVSVQAPSAAAAEGVADTVVAQATSTVNRLVAPYQLSVVSRAAGTASSSSGLGSKKVLVVLLVVGLAIGFGVQQAAAQLLPMLRPKRRRASRATGATDTPLAPRPVR